MPKDRSLPSYKPAPEPPTDPTLRRRYDVIMSVLAQTQTVTAAAESLNMSRNHFQTILHRVLEAIIEAMTPKPAGRPAKPEREAALEAELAKTKADLTALQTHTATMQRMMGALDFDHFWSGALAQIAQATEEDTGERGPGTCDDDSPGGDGDA